MGEHNHHSEAHNQRAIIGFDEHGVPAVIVPADEEKHTHTDENGNIYEHFHEADFTADYMQAVAEYRKTFPSKQDVLEKTPDPAVREMMLNMQLPG